MEEEIASRRPTELWQPAKVSGVGPTKLERYGDEVLAVLPRADQLLGRGRATLSVS